MDSRDDDGGQADDTRVLALVDAGLTDTEGARKTGISLREYQRVKASALRARQADASAALVRVLERIAVALEKLAGL